MPGSLGSSDYDGATALSWCQLYPLYFRHTLSAQTVNAFVFSLALLPASSRPAHASSRLCCCPGAHTVEAAQSAAAASAVLSTPSPLSLSLIEHSVQSAGGGAACSSGGAARCSAPLRRYALSKAPSASLSLLLSSLIPLLTTGPCMLLLACSASTQLLGGGASFSPVAPPIGGWMTELGTESTPGLTSCIVSVGTVVLNALWAAAATAGCGALSSLLRPVKLTAALPDVCLLVPAAWTADLPLVVLRACSCLGAEAEARGDLRLGLGARWGCSGFTGTARASFALRRAAICTRNLLMVACCPSATSAALSRAVAASAALCRAA